MQGNELDKFQQAGIDCGAEGNREVLSFVDKQKDVVDLDRQCGEVCDQAMASQKGYVWDRQNDESVVGESANRALDKAHTWIRQTDGRLIKQVGEQWRLLNRLTGSRSSVGGAEDESVDRRLRNQVEQASENPFVEGLFGSTTDNVLISKVAGQIFSPLNIQHAIYTIASMIGSVALIQDGDEIIIDVIIANEGNSKLLIHNFPAKQFQDQILISDLLRTADKWSGIESGLGTGLTTALQLTSRRSGVGFGRRIIVFTDGIVTNADELNALRQGLVDCDAGGIDVLGIGLGIAPLQLSKLFPAALYAPNLADLGISCAVALGVSGVRSNKEIKASLLISQTNEDRQKKLRKFLCADPQICHQLARSIRERELSKDFMEAIGKTDLFFMKGTAAQLTQNPEEEPYYEGAFVGFKILVVCLYLGANEKDPSKFKQAVFDEQCGSVLKKKGFEYTFVCSYGEGLNELQKIENGRCPFTQLWLFSSEGYGKLPEEAIDKDPNKIVPFLQAVTDFWKGGGGLFLFCDNTPYNFEANYLLKNHFIFSHGEKNGASNVRLSGFYKGKHQIQVSQNEDAAKKSFSPVLQLNSPGQAKQRLTLRPGLIQFSEGNTISYAVDDKDKPLTTAEQLWPFTPFAWTSQAVTQPRPFILKFVPYSLNPSPVSNYLFPLSYPTFTAFRPPRPAAKPRHSILVLDGSGS
ncbi:MAG: hypothetical protein EZS28_034424, partial [Streblomastix strix]